MRRRDEPGDEIEERRLAATRRSQQCYEFAAPDDEVDGSERARSVRVDLVGSGDGDDALRTIGVQGRTFTSLTIDSAYADV